MNIDNLFKLMEELNISSSKLSADTGISTGNISDWKSKRSTPSAEKLCILSEYFDVSVDYLLGKNNKTKTNNDDNTKTPNVYGSHVIAYLDVLGGEAMMKKDNIGFVKKLESCHSEAHQILTEMYKKFSQNKITINKIDFKIFSDNVLFSMQDTSSKNKGHFDFCLKFFIEFIAAFQYIAIKNYSIPFRGCICYGDIIFDNMLVSGPGLAKAVHTEEIIAFYPRVLLQDEIATDYLKILKTIITANILPIVAIDCDFDQMHFVNFLSISNENINALSCIYKKNQEWIKEYKNTPHILQKYRWLDSYIKKYCSINNIALETSSAPSQDDTAEIAADKKKSARPITDDETDIT